MTGSFYHQFTDGVTRCYETHAWTWITQAGMRACAHCTMNNNTVAYRSANICNKSVCNEVKVK